MSKGRYSDGQPQSSQPLQRLPHGSACGARRAGNARRACRRAGLVVLGAAALFAFPAGAAWAQGPENNMVEAVVEAFMQPGRKIYVAPGLLMTEAMVNAGFIGRPRHSVATLEKVRERFDATIAYPEEAIKCKDRSRPETCTLPGDGMLFQFVLPERPARTDVLPVRVILYHDGRGEGGQILREVWDLVLRREQYTGWRVVHRNLVVKENGPG